MNNVAILLNTRDRPTEVAIALQSLRTQTFRNFDVYILDDCGGTPLPSYHFFNCIINRLKQEGNKVFLKRTEGSEGVSKARQKIVDWVREMPFEYEYYCRLDDDCVFEPEYIEKLLKVIDNGYDMASGVTVPMGGPTPKRDPKNLKGVINRVILKTNGDYIFNGDDCGMEYTESVILPAHHFRSCALYKAEIHNKSNYCPTPLSWHGFREEQIFSYRLLLAGYTIGVDTGAVNYHQMTPSGGERDTQTKENTIFNQFQLEKFTRENRLKLKKLFKTDNKLTKEEMQTTTNLLMNQ